MHQTSKKLILVLAIFVPIINSDKKVDKVPSIYYLVQFQRSQEQKSSEKVKTLFNNINKVNAMNCDFV